MGLCSVAFPPIGTKGLSYPVDEVIQTMCSVIERFSATSRTSVNSVVFAFLPDDVPIRKVEDQTNYQKYSNKFKILRN